VFFKDMCHLYEFVGKVVLQWIRYICVYDVPESVTLLT
jgi:hypothetical protein